MKKETVRNNLWKVVDDGKKKTSELLEECRKLFNVYSYLTDKELDKQFPAPPKPTIRHMNKTASTNELLGLPRGRMKRVTVAFDVDGTLIKNGGVTLDIANLRIVELLKTLASFKNVRIIVWSGGGKEYARRWGVLIGVDEYVDQYASKTEHKELNVDIAVDDIQDTMIGRINLIVKEK